VLLNDESADSEKQTYTVFQKTAPFTNFK